MSSNSCNMQSQATIYARLAESPAIMNELSAGSAEVEKIEDNLQLTVLPISAENAGLLPNRGGMIFCFISFPYHDCLLYVLYDCRTFYLVFLCLQFVHYMLWLSCLWLPIYVCYIHAYVQAPKYIASCYFHYTHRCFQK